MSVVFRKLSLNGYDKDTITLIMDAWHPSTRKVYGMYLKKWLLFCVLKKVSVMKLSVQQVCAFLRQLSSEGKSYGALNTARSALATFLPAMEGHPMGKHPVICWLLKGAYERNPSAPKYTKFWDIKKVFSMLKNWGRNKELSLKDLTLKLTILLLLVTSQRGQTILSLSLKGLDLEEVAVFRLDELLKHNRSGDALSTIVLKPFDQCYRLCVVRALKAYIKRTEELRKGEEQLLISYVPPHKAISRDTLARWTLRALSLAGIDVQKYKGHSTRGASTSAAKRLGASMNLILCQAGWRNVDSFAKFYNKELDQDPQTVGQLLLRNAAGSCVLLSNVFFQ